MNISIFRKYTVNHLEDKGRDICDSPCNGAEGNVHACECAREHVYRHNLQPETTCDGEELAPAAASQTYLPPAATANAMLVNTR